MKFNKKLDEEVCNDLVALREKIKKAYYLNDNQGAVLFWKMMCDLSEFLTYIDEQEKTKVKTKATSTKKTKGGKK